MEDDGGREDGAPNTIEHLHEIIGDETAPEEVCDYLLYQWEEAGITARAYTDEMHTVSILTRGEGQRPAEAPMDVLRWLFARFHTVRALGPHGYVRLRRPLGGGL
ncbi:hypothetical protein BCF33_2650 [Hasllibacter halocynthiae]|uniref:Uncharacterized protein n=1 Tax=Hasllibacter halocynthiae TaxID=595589 RepID=A0A2T0X4A0_9RHOB|nr:hypothetical protein [Hasllibacter halocynthiae]PRY93766.1 hypothetical protein BCF33_2650 [Hasllibacter halocynthiae]